MKVVVFIMAWMVLVCSVIPCREFMFPVDGYGQNKILKSSTHQEQSDIDNCSPFCSCNCCCGITFFYTAYQVTLPLAGALREPIFHLPSKVSDTALPVWQPPQLV